MFCSKAIRILAGRKTAQLTVLCNNSSRRFLHSLKVRNFANEAKAAQRILARSPILPSDLARMCGVRLIHTTDSRRQNEEGKEKKNDDDEKDRMLSALKTAVAFFAAPMLLIFLFRSGDRRETPSKLESAQRSGE